MGENQIGSHIRRTHVPWMFFDEWERVYKDLYSNNIAKQKRAYDKILLWKTRKSPLPVGVDCTLELIRVHILDQEITKQASSGLTSTYAEHDMQLMFSSAITRFLNHVSNVAKTFEDSMYQMAEKMNIPSWVVLLRHDSAHSSSLPPLSLLQRAVHFSLSWLDENYWKVTRSIPNWTISKEKSHFRNSSMVEEIFDVWQAIQMYAMNGYTSIDEISDEQLRDNIFKNVTKRTVNEKDGTYEWNEKTKALSSIKKHLRLKWIGILNSAGVTNEKLVALLLTSQAFIPPVHLIADKYEEVTGKTILLWIAAFWKDILVPLHQKFCIFPHLVHKFITLLNEERNQHCQLVMSVWIELLCTSMLKSKAITRKVNKFGKSNEERQNKCKQLDDAEKYRKIVQESGNWEIMEISKRKCFTVQSDELENSTPDSDVKLAVLNPQKYTLIFLESLLDVAKPEVKPKTKQLLLELVSIVTDPSNIDFSKKNGHINRLEDVLEAIGAANAKAEVQMEEIMDLEGKELSLSLATAYEWSTCPLGILPWQKRSSSVLEMPSNVSWDSPGGNDETLHNIHHFSQAKVNWKKVEKETFISNEKRRKKKNLSKKGSIPKKIKSH